MRHGKKFNHLGRKAAHRKAMLSNMACSLIYHKRITTTTAKAKALRKYIEPLITKAKSNTMHSRRMVFSYLKQKEAVTILFNDVATKIGDRPGGYTRILKIGRRLGDNADMAIIELVDYNEYIVSEPKQKKEGAGKKKRRRRGGKKKSSAAADTQQAAEAQADNTATEADTDDTATTPTAEAEPQTEANQTEAPEATAQEEATEADDTAKNAEASTDDQDDSQADDAEQSDDDKKQAE